MAESSTYLTENDLWCQVLWGPAKRPGPALHPFRKSKICYLENRVHSSKHWTHTARAQRPIKTKKTQTDPYLYVTLIVNEQVLWLKISVDEIQRVKVFKGQYNLGCVEAGVWFTTKQITHNVYSQPAVQEKYRWG